MIVTTAGIQRLFIKDEIFRSIHNLYGPPPNWKREKGFASLCRIILEQQVSLSSAQATYNKLFKYTGGLNTETLLGLSKKDWQSIGVTRQKRIYLYSLAKSLEDSAFSFDEMEMRNTPEKYNYLVRLKGVGPWTANIYLLFCHQVPDIFPPGDRALIQTLREFGRPVNSENLETIVSKWRPDKSLAAFFLWHYYLKKRNRPLII